MEFKAWMNMDEQWGMGEEFGENGRRTWLGEIRQVRTGFIYTDKIRMNTDGGDGI
jgi:hypothetical protein